MVVGRKMHECRPHSQDQIYNRVTRVFTTDVNGVFHCTVCGTTQTGGVKPPKRVVED